jgi:hypothetical protein
MDRAKLEPENAKFSNWISHDFISFDREVEKKLQHKMSGVNILV